MGTRQLTRVRTLLLTDRPSPDTASVDAYAPIIHPGLEVSREVGGQLTESVGEGTARTDTDGAPRRSRPFHFSDSYAVVLLLVVVTYIVSVSVTEEWATSIVLTVQLATVWFTLRISRARPGIRFIANVVLVLAAVVAAVSFFVHDPVISSASSPSSAVCFTSSRHSRSFGISYSGQ